MNSGHRLTHVGLCVRDVERSSHFYCTALGFQRIGDMHVTDDASARLLDVDGLALELVYLERDGFRLELLSFTEPGSTGGAEPRPMNAIGFTHLSFRVDDVEALSAAIVEQGGRLLAERSVVFDGGNRGLILTDPDGTLLELIERTPRTD